VAVPVAHWQLAPTDPLAYAHDLYAALRALDESGCHLILVEAPPETAAWAAVRDRLQRAAAGSTAPSEDAT
jgi:L-threonylcarbamoyladenylate synthase